MAILDNLKHKICFHYFVEYRFQLCSFKALILWVTIYNANSHENKRTMKTEVSKLLTGSLHSAPPFAFFGFWKETLDVPFLFVVVFCMFCCFPLLSCQADRIKSTVACSAQIRNGTMCFFFSFLLAAGWMLFTVALHYSNGLIFLKASGCASWFLFFLSLFTSTESRLQPPATTWQLKTAHYKKSKKKPCLMFLLSEGGSAISSHPSQAFSFIRKFCLRLAGIWYACSRGVMRELNMVNCVDGALRENSGVLQKKKEVIFFFPFF